MNLKDLKIGMQLMTAFLIMLALIIFLGITSIQQTNQIQAQGEMLYNHPLQVRRAINDLSLNIKNLELAIQNLMLAENDSDKQLAFQEIDLAVALSYSEFDVLRDRYLGPALDIDNLNNAYTRLETNIKQLSSPELSGPLNKAKDYPRPARIIAANYAEVNSQLEIIDRFALNKAKELYDTSVKMKNELRSRLVFFVAVILLLTLLINYILMRNIRFPLDALIIATKRFHDGNMEARSLYSSKNEFGELSSSFNSLADRIEENISLNKKIVNFVSLLLSEYNAEKFFRNMLNGLVLNTGSQIAAVYLLNDDKDTFEYFGSVGTDQIARQSFSAIDFEGEFGAALTSHKMQHIKNIPQDTRFVFSTVSGQFIPSEIITIPVVIKHEVIAIISLAGIYSYSNQSIQLIANVQDFLCLRIEGILAYRNAEKLSAKLLVQRNELEGQKKTLAYQSSVLIGQNVELEEQKNQLNKANQLKTNFLSNMSHELRTPLNSVIALTGVLNRRLAEKISDEELSYLEVIERNGKLLLALINDILDISRIESGREEVEISGFNINAVIADIVNMIEPIAKTQNIGLFHTGSSSEINITSDRDKCHHILQNLISNAVKFTENGKVEITAFQNGDNIAIMVTDTGIGISEDHLPYIFDQFRQADGSTSRRFGGSGLGLSIAQKYANLLGGIVEVTSSPEKGSIFTLTLPLKYDAATAISLMESNSDYNPAAEQIFTIHNPGNLPRELQSIEGNPVILIVEDNPDNMITVKAILGNNYTILEAVNGQEGIEMANKYKPNLILMDIALPIIDGIEAFNAIRNNIKLQHIPVIALTASTMTADREVLLAYGLDAFIPKPIDDKMFFKTINSVLYGK
jgi:signal transduction histidine kinase/CheY-like chemotaxis protein